jgi:hypothetical protein
VHEMAVLGRLTSRMRFAGGNPATYRRFQVAHRAELSRRVADSETEVMAG